LKSRAKTKSKDDLRSELQDRPHSKILFRSRMWSKCRRRR